MAPARHDPPRGRRREPDGLVIVELVDELVEGIVEVGDVRGEGLMVEFETVFQMRVSEFQI